jgi:hypothetical protein
VPAGSKQKDKQRSMTGRTSTESGMETVREAIDVPAGRDAKTQAALLQQA